MLIRKFNIASFEDEYNTLCQHLYPWKDVDTPFGSMFCIVEPTNVTKLHNHHEGETFFIMRGQGLRSYDVKTA